jgi:hypothetical protein
MTCNNMAFEAAATNMAAHKTQPTTSIRDQLIGPVPQIAARGSRLCKGGISTEQQFDVLRKLHRMAFCEAAGTSRPI